MFWRRETERERGACSCCACSLSAGVGCGVGTQQLVRQSGRSLVGDSRYCTLRRCPDLWPDWPVTATLAQNSERFSIRVSPTDLQHIYVNSTHQSRWKCKYFTLVHSAQIVGSRVPNSRTSDLFTLRFYIYPIPPHHVRFALSDLACFALETRYATRRNPTTCTQQRRKSDSRCSDDRRKDCGYIEIYIASLITEPSRWHVSAEEQQWRSVTREKLLQ